MGKVKVIFLDFDGTIAESRKIAVESMTKALEDYGYFVPWNKREKYMGYPIPEAMVALGYSLNEGKKVQKRFYKYFNKGAKTGKSKICCSIKPLYELKKEYPLYIISNSKTKYLNISIKAFGIKGLFNGVYGKNNFKSKDEMIVKLCKKHKISVKEAIFVGDNFSDIRYAKKSGCISVGISNSHSWSSLKRLRTENPDYIIHNFNDLKKLVKRINLR